MMKSTANETHEGSAHMTQGEIGGHSLLAQLDMQPRVRDFLARALKQGRTSHAYLFLGAPGSGKLDAAWALAQALLCAEDPALACGACDDCRRVTRRTHPDVHYLAPESAAGYLMFCSARGYFPGIGYL